MGKDWIKRQDGNFVAQALNFTNIVAADPVSLGLSESDAALLQADNDIFQAAYKKAAALGARCKADVTAKDDARKQLAARMRDFGGRIRANRSIPDAVKVNLSLTVPAYIQSAPPGAPDSRPVVSITSVVSNMVRVLLNDDSTLFARQRPRGVIGAQVFFATGEQAPSDLSGWQPPIVTMSSKATLRLPYLPPGTKVWVVARWFNNRGETGEISYPASTHVASMGFVKSLAA